MSADVDISITDTQYDRLVTDLQGLKAKLDPLRGPLAKLMSRPAGEAKIRTWIENHPDEARLLVLTKNLHKYLNEWFADIGVDL